MSAQGKPFYNQCFSESSRWCIVSCPTTSSARDVLFRFPLANCLSFPEKASSSIGCRWLTLDTDSKKIEKKDILEISQRCFQQFPTIILGSGASRVYNLPSMESIENYILTQLKKEKNWDNERRKKIKKIIRKEDNLECAMDKLDETKEVNVKITEWIWNCVNSRDVLNYRSWANQEYNIGDLLREMFECNRCHAHIITTNYDRVAEYICHIKGLNYRIELPGTNIEKFETIKNYSNNRSSQSSRIVLIYKVHGSLDWFEMSNGETLKVPATNSIPLQFYPLIVPPGISKYQRSHQDPYRTVIKGADEAIEKSNSFLCVGFGFNDKHIQYKIEEVCKKRNIPVVVLAKELTKNAKDFLKNTVKNNYVGIEDTKIGTGSNIYTSEFPDGIRFDEVGLWSISGFCKMVLPEKHNDNL